MFLKFLFTTLNILYILSAVELDLALLQFLFQWQEQCVSNVLRVQLVFGYILAIPDAVRDWPRTLQPLEPIIVECRSGRHDLHHYIDQTVVINAGRDGLNRTVRLSHIILIVFHFT